MVKKFFAKGYVFFVLLLLYTPILFVVVFSFTNSPTMGQWRGFSFELYQNLFTGSSSAKIGEAVKNTLVLAALASVIATLLGSVAAVGIYNSKRRAKNVMLTTSQIPVLNADIVTAAALLLLFVTINLDRGFVTLLIAHVTFCTPYVVLSVMPKLKQMNQSIYEAALDLGATPFVALIRVVLPEILPGMFTGFLLSFTLSIDDFVITVYNTSGYSTLSKYIYDDAVKGGLGPELRALSTLIFAVVLILLVVVNLTSKKKGTHLPKFSK